MRKVIAIVMVVILLGVGLAAVGCQPQVEIKPCSVALVGVSPVYLGGESITMELLFKVKNPNTVAATLNGLPYTLAVNGTCIGTRGFPDSIYIPAGTEVIVSNAFVIAMPNLVPWLMVGNALMGIAPPLAAPDAGKKAGEIFASAKGGTAEWWVVGTEEFIVSGKSQTFNLSSKYQAPAK